MEKLSVYGALCVWMKATVLQPSSVWTSKLSLGPDLLPRFSCPGPEPSMPAVYPLALPQSLINVVWAGAVRNGRENHGISPSESQWHPAAAGVNRWLTTGLLAACGDSHRGRAANVALTFRWIRKFSGSALVVSEVVGIVIICILVFFRLTPNHSENVELCFPTYRRFVWTHCLKCKISLHASFINKSHFYSRYRRTNNSCLTFKKQQTIVISDHVLLQNSFQIWGWSCPGAQFCVRYWHIKGSIRQWLVFFFIFFKSQINYSPQTLLLLWKWKLTHCECLISGKNWRELINLCHFNCFSDSCPLVPELS